MRGLSLRFAAALVFHSSLSAQEVQPLDDACVQRLKTTFDITSSNGGCDSYSMLSYTNGTEGSFSDQISCTFSNLVTSYVFLQNGRYMLDLRGLDMRLRDGSGIQSNHFVSLASCDEVVESLRAIQQWSFQNFSLPPTRTWNSNESLLLVATENFCQSTASQDLIALKDQYISEGRSSTEILCLPQKEVAATNPAIIRNRIRKSLANKAGIILIGSDIPPFEYFRATGFQPPDREYAYGQSDLPYGAEDEFWSEPISKKNSRLFNKIYKQTDFVYKVTSPTLFSFDLREFIKREIAGKSRYEQKYWVARWIGKDKLGGQAFRRFVDRRKNYQPLQRQNTLFMQGANAFMYRALEYFFEEVRRADQIRWLELAPPRSEITMVLPVNLSESLRFVDPATTMLVLSEHGNPENVGNVNSQSFDKIRDLPPVLHFDSCDVGAWGIANSPATSLISVAFDVELPPLTIIASQGIKSLRTFGAGDSYVPEVYLTNWKAGQSIGEREIETVNLLFKNWRERLWSNPFWDEHVSQIFHSVSIFGDGTIEN